MQITIKYEGEYFTSPHTDESTVEAFTETMYEIGAELDRFKMQLEDGGWIVLPSDAVKKCVFIIKESE